MSKMCVAHVLISPKDVDSDVGETSYKLAIAESTSTVPFNTPP